MNVAISEEARRFLGWLRDEYIKASHPPRRQWGIVPKPEHRAVVRELRAHGIVEPHTRRDWLLTERGIRLLLGEESEGNTGVVVHHHGDVLVSGSKFNTTITNSNIKNFGQGDNVVVGDNASVGTVGNLTQAQHEEHIKAARKALIEDEDKLDDLVREALSQFLTLARKIQVEQQTQAQLQAKMKETLDEVWAEQITKGMKPKALPKTLEVVGAIAKHPATGEVVKKLLTGG
jgi:hypothetical protein